MNTLLDTLMNNDELGRKVAAMWMEGAKAQEVADVLAEAGVEVEISQVEEALALLQEKHAQDIAVSDLNPDQLAKIAGGLGACGRPSVCGFAAIGSSYNNCMSSAGSSDVTF